MGTPSNVLYSPKNLLGINYTFKTSFAHFNKHLVCTTKTRIFSPYKTLKPQTFAPLVVDSEKLRHGHLLKPVKTAVTDDFSSNFEFRPHVFVDKFKTISFYSMKETMFGFNPFVVTKWTVFAAVSVAALKWAANLMFNPFVWMYFSWTWLFWPWIIALSLGIYGIYCYRKHVNGESSIFEQISIVTATFTWLTLVPPAFFNGFLEGWPFVFFFVYHYFFFLNVSIRKRLYGDYNARVHDPKWDVNVPGLYRVSFAVAVLVGHWLAAFEGPELHLIPGGWSNIAVWCLILVTVLTQYYASLYLAKYSEKVVEPTAVVHFGPYRWVRHPIYASTMLLFCTYFAALRAPLSCLYMVAVCVLYYDQKAKLEEGLMVDTFGEGYIEYTDKVRYKFIPFVY
ncbi:hypothetical protein vseg_013133 [Gypsophila vaccaria]